MWEAIRANARRSRLLIGLMGALLVALGAVIGIAFSGDPRGALLGALGALALWFVQLALAFWGGEQLVLHGSGAREIRKEDAPRLWNVLEEMKVASGLPAMPRLYVIDRDAPNAFATGLAPERSAVAVTTGLLRRLNRDELQGVVGHEIGHIVNRDSRFLTLAAVMLGSITLLSDLYLRGMLYGGARRLKLKGPAAVVVVVGGVVVAVLAPLGAMLLYAACSRRREFLADASSARFTRYPLGLAA
ncbi:MAG TPA: M48 family metalloprotease, partial [Candidatus Polarisedimenticolaceae bacterium]|nr:M48 family metalloprotease [Candidatus Polarisedimenticolaceae bacterium]